MPDSLTLRQLNRATLARQLLLARERLAPVEAVEHLGGLQAQEPKPAFAALWTRLEGFERARLHESLTQRSVVRGTMMRATLHIASAPDYARLRTALQPMLTGAMEGILRQRGDVDLDRVLPVARELLRERPRTFNDLRAELSERFPEFEHRAIGYAVRMQLPLLMVPSEDRWSFPSDACFALAEDWIDEPLAPPDLAALVRRHLGAFGPASAADVQAWSGLKGMKDVLDGMADELVEFTHGRRTLYDLPGAPRPDEDTPAPPRLLPEFDSLLLAHQDRTRVIADDRRKALATKNLRIQATFLVDGFVAGSWAIAGKGGKATMTLSAFEPLDKAVKEQLAAEAEALLRFLDDGTAGPPRVAFAQR
jgi:Winged helix DNA-binding domain